MANFVAELSSEIKDEWKWWVQDRFGMFIHRDEATWKSREQLMQILIDTVSKGV